ncbi:RES domain-containing protein [Roseovarius sp. A21]|uniref:RES domain-containing protein n=1 Tax=Roseovarius bejariae TaxID=2576383 RepID=A0A844CWQ6_9RHOB|nr:RES domain-containing protein [Roseovarius bejariae]
MTRLSDAPERTHRLIPSRFPPIDAFETVTSAGDLEPVLELEGWTNDRLVAPRLKRLPKSEWVYGRANASVVMAAFLHGAPQGTRFAGPDLGAWYASSALETSVLEVVSGIRREIALSALEQKTEELREYTARLEGSFVDIRGTRPDLHDPDPANYPASQVFSRSVRTGPHDGITYDSVRHSGGVNWVSYRPSRVQDVLKARHFRVVVPRSGKVVVEKMRADT